MRLLDVSGRGATKELKDFVDPEIPAYAILSHTWEQEEVTFQDLGDPESLRDRGYAKINQTCAIAAQDGFRFAWVDTCCIDKTSSAELSEAINSMFYWYERAEICYVYLSDLPPGADLESALGACRWFTRGWTLQELIGPRNMVFYDSEWNARGTKMDLSDLLSTITGIPASLLRHTKSLSEFNIARKMSWASQRRTTRIEDMAYCLLGIFDVNMSPRYGERTKAFTRLQQTILQQPTAELSIFAWTDDEGACPNICSVLAPSPRQFRSCSFIEGGLEDSTYRGFANATRGIQVKAAILEFISNDPKKKAVLSIQAIRDDAILGVSLRKISGSVYARLSPSTLVTLSGPGESYYRTSIQTIFLASLIPPRFPFHGAGNPVLGNRSCALRLDIRNRTGIPQLELSPYRPVAVYPLGQWDNHDQVLFGTDTISLGWGVFVLKLQVKSPLGEQPVAFHRDVFVSCFSWVEETPRPPRLAVLQSVGMSNWASLHATMKNIGFESSSEAEALASMIFGDNLSEGLVSLDVPVRDGYHGGGSVEIPITLNAELQTEHRPDLLSHAGSMIKVLRVTVEWQGSESGRELLG